MSTNWCSSIQFVQLDIFVQKYLTTDHWWVKLELYMCKMCSQYWQPFSTHHKSQECTCMSTQSWDCTVVSETNITVSQPTKSERKCHMTDQHYHSLTKCPVGSVLLLGHWSAHCLLVLARAPVTIQRRKRSRNSRNGHVQNFDWQDVDVALFPGLLHLKNWRHMFLHTTSDQKLEA